MGMSKVYLVTWSDWDSHTIYGVFSTLGGAEALIAEAARHDPKTAEELDIEEEELDLPLGERGMQMVQFASDWSVNWAPPFQWSTTEVRAPSFRDQLGGMWHDRVAAQRLVVEVHAHSEAEGREKAIVLAQEIKAAVPWGDNEALAKWWSDRNPALCGNP
jgi:hypothetical protein